MVKEIEISIEQLQNLVEKGLDKEKTFEEQVQDWIENECSSPNLLNRSDANVEAVQDCIGYECPCSPSREDCCKNYDIGKCKIVININKVCGIEEYAKDPKLITASEAEILSKVLSEYYKNS